ncbi:MAG: Rrf2 family transcriptional regulator [Leptospiraceae bacterium]|nr:Rrf2 family transcriptional regulator [Leptospiraceae bacterium]
MKITSKGRYGLKAMMTLCEPEARARLLKTREIAEKQSIPVKYLEQIINTLKKRRLVTSVRGSEGGYRLAREPETITVYEILSALEGDLSVLEKDADLREGRQGVFWNELDSNIRHMLEIPLTEFVRKNQEAEEGLMYYI